MNFDIMFQLIVGVALCAVGFYFTLALNLMTNHDTVEEKK